MDLRRPFMCCDWMRIYKKCRGRKIKVFKLENFFTQEYYFYIYHYGDIEARALSLCIHKKCVSAQKRSGYSPQTPLPSSSLIQSAAGTDQDYM